MESTIEELKRGNENLLNELENANKKIEKSKDSHKKRLFLEKEQIDKLSKALDIETQNNKRLQKEFDNLKNHIIESQDIAIKISNVSRHDDQIESLNNIIYDYKQLNDELKSKVTACRVEINRLNSQIQKENRANNSSKILINVILIK